MHYWALGIGEWYGRTSYLQDKTTGILAGALAGYVQQTVTLAAGIVGSVSVDL